jgi:hypothetical protein
MISHMLRAAGAGPTFIGYTYAAAASSASTTVDVAVPSGAITGDILIACAIGSVGDDPFSEISSPSFTQLKDAAARYAGRVTWDGSSGPFTFTQDLSGGGGILQVILMAFRAGSYDVIGSLGSESATPSAPSITLSQGNSVVIATYSDDNSLASYSTPTDYTEIYDSGTGIATFYKTRVASGATGTVSSTASSGNKNRGFLIGLKP